MYGMKQKLWLPSFVLLSVPLISILLLIYYTGQTYWLGLIGVYAVMSIVTYFVYEHDKKRAVQKAWRVPEHTLHILELLGGWYGAWYAQKTIFHKNKKWAYQIAFWGIVFLHWVCLAAMAYQFGK